MFAKAFHIGLAALVLLVSGGCKRQRTDGRTGHPPERIVTMAPNITETVYALGLGDRLVGDTPYCRYPEAARALPKIGGFGDFNYEAIVALHPDLAILHREYTTEKARLAELGIPTLETGSYFMEDIFETIRSIGKTCGAEAQASNLIQSLEARVAEVRKQGRRAAPPPRMLVVFGNTEGGTVQAFGANCLHSQLIEIAGGKNAVESKLPFARLSKEGIIRIDPDIVVELRPGEATGTPPSPFWKQLPSIGAVENGQIYVLTGDYTCIPGPRFIQTLEDFSRIVARFFDAAKAQTKSPDKPPARP